MQRKIDETRKRADEISEVKKRNEEKYKKRLFDIDKEEREIE